MATFLQENRWFIARASTGCSSWDLCFSRLLCCCQSPGFWTMELGVATPGYLWPIGLFILLATFIKRQSSDFAVTNKRVMMKVGVFSTRSVELLLNKIEAISVNQSFIGRIFGYGDIVVTGSGGTREAFSHIEGPLEFRRAVQSVTDTRSSPPQNAAPPTSGDAARK